MLTNQQLHNIINTIVLGYQPEKIILFGSYANGQPNKDSDVDLMIIKETDVPYIKRPRIIRNLFNPYPAPMDIFVYTPEEFNSHTDRINGLAFIVNKYGKVVYEKVL